MSERYLTLDFTDREFEQEHRLNSESQNQPPPPPSHPSINPAQLPRQDLIDTYNLSRNYLNHKIVDLNSNHLSEEDSLSKKFRENLALKAEEIASSLNLTREFKAGFNKFTNN